MNVPSTHVTKGDVSSIGTMILGGIMYIVDQINGFVFEYMPIISVFFMALGALMAYWNYRKQQKLSATRNEILKNQANTIQESNE